MHDRVPTGERDAAPILAITESHTDTITNLRFHVSLLTPGTMEHEQKFSEAGHTIHLISSSTDGLVTIIDPTIPDEDDSVQVVLNNRSVVQHIKPFTGPDYQLLQSGRICTISQDEKLAVHAVAENTSEHASSDPQPFDLRSELRCDYVIGLLEQQNGGNLILAVGAFKEETTDSPHVDLYTFRNPPRPSEKPDLELVARLQGAHGEEIVRDVWFQDGVPFMLTCGEDGMVRVWEEVEAQSQGKSGKTPRKERKRVKEGGGFKPY